MIFLQYDWVYVSLIYRTQQRTFDSLNIEMAFLQCDWVYEYLNEPIEKSHWNESTYKINKASYSYNNVCSCVHTHLIFQLVGILQFTDPDFVERKLIYLMLAMSKYSSTCEL